MTYEPLVKRVRAGLKQESSGFVVADRREYGKVKTACKPTCVNEYNAINQDGGYCWAGTDLTPAFPDATQQKMAPKLHKGGSAFPRLRTLADIRIAAPRGALPAPRASCGRLGLDIDLNDEFVADEQASRRSWVVLSASDNPPIVDWR